MYVDGNAWVDIPAAAWGPIDKQVAVAFWAFGDEAMPVDHFVFSAYSNPAVAAARQASAHIP